MYGLTQALSQIHYTSSAYLYKGLVKMGQLKVLADPNGDLNTAVNNIINEITILGATIITGLVGYGCFLLIFGGVKKEARTKGIEVLTWTVIGGVAFFILRVPIGTMIANFFNSGGQHT